SITKHRVRMDKKKQKFSLTLKEEPLKIQVDPQFNLFRKLHYSEIPPSLSKIFGAEKVIVILPSKATNDEKNRYKKLAGIWATEKEKFEVVTDTELKFIPKDRAVWIFGWNNKFRTIIERGLKGYDSKIDGDFITLGKTKVSKKENSIVVSVRHPNNNDYVAIWVAVHDDAAVAGLARKLPHYGKYSYLTFTCTEPSNVVKGQWSTVASPLIRTLIPDDDSGGIKLSKREALAKLAPVFSAKRMKKSVDFLASDELKGRGLGTPELDKAADYIAQQFKLAELLPAGDDATYFQDFVTKVGMKKRRAISKNVLGYIKGTNKDWTSESVVISAHYDHLGLGWPDVKNGNLGKIHNGADDNASGVAILLELAQTLKRLKPKRSIVFAAFSGEEAGLLGAKYYVKNMNKFPIDKIMGIINIDTVGSLNENKLMILGGASATEWKHIFMGTSFVTGIETVMVSQAINSSDQVAFVEAGVPGVQLFAGSSSSYHKPSDTSDKIDISGLVKVATVAKEVINYLSEREQPLSFGGAKQTVSIDKTVASMKTRKAREGRKVSTGITPDFAFAGSGMKVGAVAADSPAAKAEIEKGDIIIKLNDTSVTDLRSYSNALKKHNVGDIVTLVCLRGDSEYTTRLKLIAR
ncbi:MAG: M20/M25/M40 family metallo-hydrolase, partial [Kangiellaceae bacterium]|nr:M20/M25/M40 family metallo-hydrolase [Kangiellaceae bacterium]